MSHKKFGPDRFSRFDVYWIQTDRQTDKQTDKPNLYIILSGKAQNMLDCEKIAWKPLIQPPFFSLNYTTKFKWIFFKKGSPWISKNLDTNKRLLLSELVKTSGVFVFKTYFITEGKSDVRITRIRRYKIKILIGSLSKSKQNTAERCPIVRRRRCTF